MVTCEPWLRMSGTAPSPLKRRISLPEPPSPRLKSMLATAIVPGSCLAGSLLGVGATVAAGAIAGLAAATGSAALTALMPARRPDV